MCIKFTAREEELRDVEINQIFFLQPITKYILFFSSAEDSTVKMKICQQGGDVNLGNEAHECLKHYFPVSAGHNMPEPISLL